MSNAPLRSQAAPPPISTVFVSTSRASVSRSSGCGGRPAATLARLTSRPPAPSQTSNQTGRVSASTKGPSVRAGRRPRAQAGNAPGASLGVAGRVRRRTIGVGGWPSSGWATMARISASAAVSTRASGRGQGRGRGPFSTACASVCPRRSARSRVRRRSASCSHEEPSLGKRSPVRRTSASISWASSSITWRSRCITSRTMVRQRQVAGRIE
jgi:hypothetical protein